jgi:hypothetical protein
MSVRVKDLALTIGSQLATIEDHVARCAGMTMQAAIHNMQGILESAVREATELEFEVLRLQDMLIEMQSEMQR